MQMRTKQWNEKGQFQHVRVSRELVVWWHIEWRTLCTQLGERHASDECAMLATSGWLNKSRGRHSVS